MKLLQRFPRMQVVLCISGLLVLTSSTWLWFTHRTQQAASEQQNAFQFTDVTQESGIHFQHTNGAFGLKLMPETLGSGVCVFDFDGDGWQDIFFVNSRTWTAPEIERYLSHQGAKQRGKVTIPPPSPSGGALYRNLGGFRFEEVTRGSGLEVSMCGMGAYAADYDADGRQDLYVTAWPRNYLFHNEGKGRFHEVAELAGVAASQWSTAALWLDYDGDELLDLFVGRYVDWAPERDKYLDTQISGKTYRLYSSPGYYGGSTCLLFHNRGNGTFEDVSQRAGITQSLRKGASKPLLGKTLGAVVLDFDADGRLDIAVANDQTRNFLFRNTGHGTFEEIAERADWAYGPHASERAGMGLDAADTDHSGRESLIVGNFERESMGLYQHYRSDMFFDVAGMAGISTPSFLNVTFGCLFADIDNDSWPDIAVANGHIEPEVDTTTQAHFAQSLLLFRNQGRRISPSPVRADEMLSYATFSPQSSPIPPIVGRGAAAADFDQDGAVDLVVTSNGGRPYLLRNDSENHHHTLRLHLRGAGRNHDAIGAQVTVRANNLIFRRRVGTGQSYCSQSEFPMTLGIGDAHEITVLVVHWPSGAVSRFSHLAAGQSLVIDEAKGIIQHRPLSDSALPE